MHHRFQVKKQKNKIRDHRLTKKTKAANIMKIPTEDRNTEQEEASIMTDFDYRDTINVASMRSILKQFASF